MAQPLVHCFLDFFMCTCMLVYARVEARGPSWVSLSISLHLTYLLIVLEAGSPTEPKIHLSGWLVSHGILLSLPPRAGTACVHCHAQLFNASAVDLNWGPSACAASVSPLAISSALVTAFKHKKSKPLRSPFESSKCSPLPQK